MKTLTLVRHAKSSWKDPKLADLDRPLNKRGRSDAPATARRFAAAFACPDRILVSPALRTRETARELASSLGAEPDVIDEETRIYEASHAGLFAVLRELPESIADVMMIGHSPGIDALGYALCGKPAGKFPTCAILRMRLPDLPWAGLAGGDGEFVLFDTPKQPVLPDP